MSAHAYDVSVADFDQKVLAASRGVPVIVDFWADWCQPCRILKPILEKLAEEYGGRFLLAKIDSDRNPELPARYGVRGIPAVKAFLDGELIDEFTGALPEGQIREFLGRLIPSPAEPFRRAAQEAMANGDHDAALALLSRALAADADSEVARLDLAEVQLATRALDDARQSLDALSEHPRNTARADALRARLALYASVGDADPGELARQVAAAPDDLDARLRLSNSLSLSRNYRAAMEQLLEIVRRNRSWNDEAGRKALLALFTLLGSEPEHEDLVREFRIALARTLN